MRKYTLVLLAFFLGSFAANAQSINPKRLKLLSNNLFARENPVISKKNDEACSVIFVDIVGVKDLIFSEAEQEPTYSQNRYTVYVPSGTKSLTYKRGNETGTIIFAEYGPEEVDSKKTYSLMLETENKMRSAVFYVNPQNALLTVNGNSVELDEKGTGSVDMPVGNYSYTVSCNGYKTETGTIQLKDDEIICINDIQLEQIKYDFQISCLRPEATLFIDGIPQGKLSEIKGQTTITSGKHDIRVTLEGYDDYTESINVAGDISMTVSLEAKKTKIIRHKEERTKSSVSLRNHTDILFSDHSFTEDFKTHNAKLSFDFHQYIGHFAIKEGIEFGMIICSEDFQKKIDDYTEFVKDNEKNPLAASLDVPVQIGFALPMSKYNTSYVDFLAGGYASGYYIGHASKSMTTGESGQTCSYDYGLRANVTFYLNKFVLDFEASQSLSKYEFGTYVGVKIGCKLFYSAKKQK